MSAKIENIYDIRGILKYKYILSIYKSETYSHLHWTLKRIYFDWNSRLPLLDMQWGLPRVCHTELDPQNAPEGHQQVCNSRQFFNNWMRALSLVCLTVLCRVHLWGMDYGYCLQIALQGTCIQPRSNSPTTADPPLTAWNRYTVGAMIARPACTIKLIKIPACWNRLCWVLTVSFNQIEQFVGYSERKHTFSGALRPTRHGS